MIIPIRSGNIDPIYAKIWDFREIVHRQIFRRKKSVFPVLILKKYGKDRPKKHENKKLTVSEAEE
jgi:hypothetical protein